MGWIRDLAAAYLSDELNKRGKTRAEIFIYMAQLGFSVIGSQSVSNMRNAPPTGFPLL